MAATIAPLDSRKQTILKAVVDDYVRTAEPVGSAGIMARYQLGVRSATIRNEMAELSEMGYLRQPHTSAGRVPSDLGYRFYVDWLMGAAGIPSSEANQAREKLTPRSEIDLVIEQTCRILSQLSRYASIATRPQLKDDHISHVTISQLGATKLLAVLVLDSGRVLHDVLELPAQCGKLDPTAAANFLTQRLAGKTLGDAASMDQTEPDAVYFDELWEDMRDFLARECEAAENAEVHIEGANYIIQQPEFKKLDRLEALLSVLEERSALYKLFSSVYLGPGATVIIGSENPIGVMSDCSFVGAKYRIGRRVAGTIGVLGPTRMDYRRAVGAVEFMAANLGDVLTYLAMV